MRRGVSRHRWEPEAATPLVGVQALQNGDRCRVCGVPTIPGETVLHLRWTPERSHYTCGWITPGESAAMSCLLSGVFPVDADTILSNPLARGYVKRERTVKGAWAYCVTESGKRALARGW